MIWWQYNNPRPKKQSNNNPGREVGVGIKKLPENQKNCLLMLIANKKI